MRWLALGETEGSAALRHTVAAAVLMVGLLASQSRGGLMGFVLSAAVLLVVLRRRLLTGLLTTAVVGFGLAWVDLSGVVAGFESRSIKASRLDLWQDALRLVPDFPILGAGLNAFGTAFSRYQTIWRGSWVGEAHNEYLQVLVDTGVLGVVLAVPFLGLLLRNALRAARRGRPLDAGFLAALLGSALHNLVEFNWQIPANALAFVAIAGLATRRGLELSPPAQADSPPELAGDVDPSEQDA